MMRSLSTLVLLCFALVCGAATAADELPAATLTDHPLAGKIWLVKERQFITREQLAELFADRQFVFLGETHDNPQHHQLQAWALQQLIDHGRKPAVALEMVDEKQGAQLNASEIKTSAQFFDTIAWEKTGWPARPFYAPLIDVVVQNKLPIIAANLDRQALRDLIGNQDKAALADLADYIKARAPVPGEEEAMKQEIIAFHCGMLPESAVPKLMYGQQLRDAIMARALIQHAAKDGAALIAGAAHVRSDRGAPAYVRGRQSDITTFSLAWAEVEQGFDQPDAYAHPWRSDTLPFDAVWFTPATTRNDPCAQMKEQFKKHAEQHKPESNDGAKVPNATDNPK